MLNKGGHGTSSSLGTKGKKCNVEKEEVLGLLRGVAREDGSLDSHTIG